MCSSDLPIKNYAENLDWMVKTAAEKGAGAMFITPTNQGLVDQIYQGGAGWDPYFAAQKAVAEWNKLPIVSATEVLRADPLPTSQKFVDQMHPSSEGAADLGRALASALVAAGWPSNTLISHEPPFLTEGLVDDAHIPPGGQAKKLSPQAQLFPDLPIAVASQATEAPSPLTPSHTPPLQNPAPTGPPQAPTGPGPRSFRGHLLGGHGPFEISVRSQGRPIGFTHLSAPGEFSLKIPGDLLMVEVEVTDANGKVVRAEGAADQLLEIP